MVGLVIVTHSRRLAEALVELISQVAKSDAPIAFAGGVGEDRQEFGTDAVELMDAIQAVYSPEGVLVLMDLGSAVLSAKLAIELLPPDISERVKLCPGPVVEGAIAAAVQAGLGSDLDKVYQEAMSALMPKLDQFDISDEAAFTPYKETQRSLINVHPANEVETLVTLVNMHGLHARPAAQFVKTAASYDADIVVWNATTGKGPVTAKSLNAVATLGAIAGHQVSIRATGPQAQQALAGLRSLVEGGFGEPMEGTAAQLPGLISSNAPSETQLVPVSEGVAIGPIYKYRAKIPQVQETQLPEGSEPAEAWHLLEQAIQRTRQNIQEQRIRIASQISENESAIFSAHELILEDPELLNHARHLIYEGLWNPAYAWQKAIDKIVDAYNALDDPYLRQRAADVRDVGGQVLLALSGESSAPGMDLPGQVILFATELTPTETARMDLTNVLGIITASGGPTSHSAILARALGIPAVCGAGSEIENLPEGAVIGLDGFTGSVTVNPNPSELVELEDKRKSWIQESERLKQSSQQPGMTLDGRRIEIASNAGSILDAVRAAENGAEAIGLLRTEFLFLTRQTPPAEDEQYEILLKIGAALTENGRFNRPIIVRTLDVGGDKELPYIDQAKEANPFLGVRALRLSLRRPELFIPQLKAILRAGSQYPYKIMFPMVANLDEIRQAKDYLVQAHLVLQAENKPHLWPVECGMMVEIPASAITSDFLATEVDFFSIGTNDLTQYTLAAERGNPELATMADAMHPAVLRLISEVVKNAKLHGKWVGVCGELAGDPAGAVTLVGLGVDELSMTPTNIPRIKEILRFINTSDVRQIADKAMEAPDTSAARSIAEEFLAGLTTRAALNTLK